MSPAWVSVPEFKVRLKVLRRTVVTNKKYSVHIINLTSVGRSCICAVNITDSTAERAGDRFIGVRERRISPDLIFLNLLLFSSF